MSLILDALARANGDTPEDATEPRQTASKRILDSPWSLVVLAAVLSGGLVYALLKPGQDSGAGGSATGPEPRPAATTEIEPRMPGVAEAERPGAAVSSSADTPKLSAVETPSSSSAAVAALYAKSHARAEGQTGGTAEPDTPAQVSTAIAPPEDAGGEAGSAVGEVGVPNKESPVSTDMEADGKASVAATEEPIDLERVLREVRAEASAAALTPHPVPLLDQLSKQFRDRVPTLMYLRHDYNPGGASTVLINSEVLSVGGRSRGVELRSVLVDSAIFRYEGTEFRLRALNSWVNL